MNENEEINPILVEFLDTDSFEEKYKILVATPLLDYDELMNDISIRGAFFRELLPKLNSDDEEERKTAAAALRYGLSALEGNDIVDF